MGGENLISDMRSLVSERNVGKQADGPMVTSVSKQPEGSVVADRNGSKPLERNGSKERQGSKQSNRKGSKNKGPSRAAPPQSGLIVSLDEQGRSRLRFVPDKGLDFIHPHIHVPADLQDPEQLAGGGSGVTVFKGSHPDFGEVVMKHGGFRDTVELFALATITEQLNARSVALDAAEAAEEMRVRLPQFKFLYISRAHLRDRGLELWSILRSKMRSDSAGKIRQLVLDAKKRKDRTICLWDSNGDRTKTRLANDVLEIVARPGVEFDAACDSWCSPQGSGYDQLHKVVGELSETQREMSWKFTLAQSAIGGKHPVQGSKLLTDGKLDRECLDLLMKEEMRVINCLRKLTYPEEAGGLGELREEVERIRREDLGPEKVSKNLDSFVGLAVKKNWHPEIGRFKKLRDVGEAFRLGKPVLLDDERQPALFLGMLLESGSRLEEIFSTGLTGTNMLDAQVGTWRSLLEDATNMRSTMALSRVWTCGLADGGLHNMFVSEWQVWLYDLGEPALMPLPALLTKFLFSFFHNLGMEETPSGSWVNRFQHEPDANGGVGRLRLTPETEVLLAEVSGEFHTTLNRFVQYGFAGEEGVRDLLIRYVELQLLSDAAFCLERWEAKGGGAERLRPVPLEKWLWRSLWDLYAASYVASRSFSDESLVCSSPSNESRLATTLRAYFACCCGKG
eukprot:TRINITY_DN34855_c0_g1_i1.p1 TRINITY_DN34855_c0_g1~~TRINITY_DN34855_c0_g1_i1.p1  ORF type:complete len:679 (-),score=146.27 TRINITY_DN34855_c0_g1_i1:122-2158(-)